jgi:F0F1-type ATP synthase membrane subunit c/vacuolar-type H+-ATPase subunit K
MGRFRESLLLALAFGIGGHLFSAFAQCAMCRTAITGSSRVEEIARILNTAILALLIPPVALLGLVFWLALTVWNRQPEHEEEAAASVTGGAGDPNT